ncbi:MAG: type VI secretion system baseplate subunit TssE [bacterium]|nr:type VI secretion system baseplate subunit TssE [bacterium]
MANERTLIERLMYPDLRPGRSARERKDHLADSVVRHLIRLLNSRQGCCLTLPDYGMPDFNESLGSKNEMQAAFESAIRSTIQKYEPRLRHVVVHLEEDEGPRLNPRFLVTAELVSNDDIPKQVSFATVMDANGKISVM